MQVRGKGGVVFVNFVTRTAGLLPGLYTCEELP